MFTSRNILCYASKKYMILVKRIIIDLSDGIYKSLCAMTKVVRYTNLLINYIKYWMIIDASDGSYKSLWMLQLRRYNY